jgi:hypothetical protein
VGNPDLDPEYTNNYELGYSTFIKGTSLNFSTFVRNTTGSIQSVRDTLGIEGVPKVKGQITTRYDNIGYENAYGASIFANVNIGNKFTLNGGTDMYYAVLDNEQTGSAAASNSGFVYSGRLFGNYSLPKDWALQFFGFYRGNRVQLQGSQGGFGTYSLGFRKQFSEKKASLGFAAENFFTNEMKITSELSSNNGGIVQNSVNTMRNMSFRVNFSYRIGKMSFDKQPRPRRRKSVNNDDLKEAGGGDGGMEMGAQQGGQTQPRGTGVMIAPIVAPKADTQADTAKATVDATGTWSYTLESPQGTTTGSFVITKEGDVYSGTTTSSRTNQTVPFTSVSVAGNELTASYTANFGGNEVVITIKGPITENDFDGTMSFGQFRTVPLKAKR